MSEKDIERVGEFERRKWVERGGGNGFKPFQMDLIIGTSQI